MPLGGRLYAHPGPQSVVPPCDSADPGGGATHKRGGAWPPSDEARAAGPQDEVGDRTSQRTTIRQHNTLYPSILVAFETVVISFCLNLMFWCPCSPFHWIWSVFNGFDLFIRELNLNGRLQPRSINFLSFVTFVVFCISSCQCFQII